MNEKEREKEQENNSGKAQMWAQADPAVLREVFRKIFLNNG